MYSTVSFIVRWFPSSTFGLIPSTPLSFSVYFSPHRTTHNLIDSVLHFPFLQIVQWIIGHRATKLQTKPTTRQMRWKPQHLAMQECNSILFSMQRGRMKYVRRVRSGTNREAGHCHVWGESFKWLPYWKCLKLVLSCHYCRTNSNEYEKYISEFVDTDETFESTGLTCITLRT